MSKQKQSSVMATIILAIVFLLLVGLLPTTKANAANITIETASPFRDTVQAGQALTLTYKFSVTAPTTTAHKVFVHFMNTAGQIVLQDDFMPPDATTTWSNTSNTQPDRMYTRTITIPSNFAAGDYLIAAGLYDAVTGTRLILDKGYRVADLTNGFRSYVISKLTITTRPIRNASFTCASIYSDPTTWPDRTANLNTDLAAIVSKVGNTRGEIYKLPMGGCRYSNILTLYGKTDVEVTGKGIPDTILMTTDPNKSSFSLVNSNTLAIHDFDIKVKDKPTVRSTSGSESRGINVDTVNNLTIREIRTEQMSGAGIVLYKVTNGQVISNEVYNTLADGIHITGAGTDTILVDRNLAEYTGDDSFSSIGYGPDIVKNITITNNISDHSSASGVSIEGTTNATVTGNTIRSSGVAGIRIASINYWNTTGVNTATVTGNTLDSVRTNCDVDHAAVMIFSDLANMSNINFSNNTILNPRSAIGVWSFGLNGATLTSETVNNNTFTVNQQNSNCANNSPTNLTACVTFGPNVISPTKTGNKLNGANCL